MFRNGLSSIACLIALSMLSGCALSREKKHDQAIIRAKEYVAKDFGRALFEYRVAIQAVPKDAEAWYQLGLVYVRARDLQNAAETFRTAIELRAELWPSRITTRENYGPLPFGRTQRARLLFSPLQTLDPGQDAGRKPNRFISSYPFCRTRPPARCTVSRYSKMVNGTKQFENWSGSYARMRVTISHEVT
ncbi:MAG: tetratricopeptide repeat protein [Acidobacteriaceae bacterium]|nr:tetratricopeptide repeat protein [Acidobacteriaceae bacterium]